MAQADELLRLRDEARLAAEREALEIVTAARRDVRRIVVQARRELLVLTAQLHAAIESVDQASLGASPDEAVEAPAHQALASNAPLGSTRELVMGARREVRSVLDEARAEIEALAAEASGPLRDEPAALAPAAVREPFEPPIPTLDTILGADSSSARASAAAVTSTLDMPPAEQPTPGYAAAATVGTTSADDIQAPRQPSWLPTIDTSPIASLPTHTTPAPMHVEEAVSLLAVTDARSPFAGFPESESVDPAAPLATFGETGPITVTESPRVFLADLDDGPRSRPAWLWVSLFAATGVLAIAGTGWWFTTRDTGGVLAAPATAGAESAGPDARGTTPPAEAAPALVAAAAPSVLSIEVRRTAWIRTLVDGKEDSRVYQAGEARQIVGAKTVSIRAGDAGAVFVSLDGRPAEALGTSGQAVTKQYSLATDAGVTPAVATTPTSSVAAAATAAAAESTVTGLPRTELGAAPGAARNTEAAVPSSPPPAPSPAPAAAPAAPAASSASAPAATDAGAAAAPAGNANADLVSAGQQWLDAYQRRDRDTMSAAGTENMSVSDERSVTERFPAWQVGVRRDLDQVELQLIGDTAVMTARMTERSGDGTTTSAQHVSRVSQTWLRRNGRWRLDAVRIIGEARLNQIVR